MLRLLYYIYITFALNCQPNKHKNIGQNFTRFFIKVKALKLNFFLKSYNSSKTVNEYIFSKKLLLFEIKYDTIQTTKGQDLKHGRTNRGVSGALLPAIRCSRGDMLLRGLSCVAAPIPKTLKDGSCAIESCEPCQVGDQAALSDEPNVPRGRLF